MTAIFARCYECCRGVAFVALLAAATASAQTVNGKIVAKSDGAPVPAPAPQPVAGAIVALLDSAGHLVMSKLAEDGGGFSFLAPSAGRYSVRVDRVGFRSTVTAPFLVRQADTVDVPITIVSESVSLRAIVVSADRRCLVRPQEGVATAALWSEARKALNATQLTQLAQAAAKSRRDPHRFAVRWRKFKRDLEPRTLESMHDEQVELEGEAVTPFVSADPEMLARDGYVSGTIERGSTFYAPDAAILLSDRFLDTHCFRLEAADRDRRDDLIGLAFEPVSLTSDLPTGRVDVRGVLWLDRASAELRYMEYTYVNLPIEANTRHAGGRLEFRPLPDGRWIVWRWYIRTPGLERHRVSLNSQTSDWRTEIARIHEDGAELLEVMPTGTPRVTRATLRGHVVDSLRGRAMTGVRVFLSGTSFAASTEADGSYLIESVPPGRYTASFIAPGLDSLLIDPPAQELSLSAGEDKRVDMAIPSLRTVSRDLCAAPLADSASVIRGIVRDSGMVIAGVQVRADWSVVLRAGTNGLRSQAVSLETTTTTGGRYSLCGLPAATRITLRASRGRAVTTSALRPLVPGELRRADLALRAP